MSAIYPNVKLYIDLDNDRTTETDITSRVTSSFDGQNGIFSYRETERISSVGSLSFRIDNADGTYTDCESLIGKAISVRLVVGSREKQVFFGYIASAKIDPTDYGKREVHVQVLDWMNQAEKSRVKNIALATFVTADESIPTLLDATVNPPAHTQLENGFERFPNMFDGALKKTAVYSEMDKIVKSELGNLYLRFRASDDGETLVFENYLHRGSKHPLSNVPMNVVTPSLRKYRSNGVEGYRKYRGNSAAEGRRQIAQAQQAFFDKVMVDSEWDAGQNVVNQMSVNNIPRDTDTIPVALYKLSSPIRIGTGQTFVLEGSFTDPNGGTLIQAKDVVFDISNYEFNSASDGTGTNLKGLGAVQTNFFATTNSFTLTIWNGGAVGYLTSAEVMGKGIYKYSQIETLRENAESQEEIVRNVVPDSITREYSNDYNVSRTFADGVLAVDRTPRKVMKSVSFLANISEHLMMAFMYLEQGDKVRIVESNPAHTGDYYIQGIKFRIDMGGIVYFTWYLKEDTETICEPIVVRAPDDPVGRRVALDFGILPYLSNMPKFSYSAWVKRTADPFAFAVIVSRTVDTGSGRRGNLFEVSTSGRMHFVSYKTPNDGRWNTDFFVVPVNVWTHVVVTYDNTTDKADARFYVNGVEVNSTEAYAPLGSTDDDSDCPTILFNLTPNPLVSGQRYYHDVIHNVEMKDVRIYNKELELAEIVELANGENDYSTVQDGLVFNGIYVPVENRDAYVNSAIQEQELVLDSVHKAVGIPYNEDESSSDIMLYGLDL